MITVAIVDDHRILADALHILYQNDPEFSFVGSACTLAEGLKLIQRLGPKVLLLDVSLPDGSSLEVVQKIRKSSPGTEIILLTSLSDEATLARAVNSGVSGFFSKRGSVTELMETVRKVASGEIVMPAALLLRMLRRMPRSRSILGNDDQVWEQLTAREVEILSYLAQGKSGKDIALSLCITPLTVRTHVRNLMSKMGVHSRLEAVTFGMRNGLINS